MLDSVGGVKDVSRFNSLLKWLKVGCPIGVKHLVNVIQPWLPVTSSEMADRFLWTRIESGEGELCKFFYETVVE